MGAIRRHRRAAYLHEDVRGFSAAQRVAEEIWIRARPRCRGCEGIAARQTLMRPIVDTYLRCQEESDLEHLRHRRRSSLTTDSAKKRSLEPLGALPLGARVGNGARGLQR